MSKQEIKEVLKPLIEECIKEMILDGGEIEKVIKESIFQSGTLSNLIKEVASGLNNGYIQQAAVQNPVQTQFQQPQQTQHVQQELQNEFNFIKQQKIALQEEAIRSLEERKRKLESTLGSNFEGVFENVNPISNSGNPNGGGASSSPLSGYAPGDAGVDITGIMALSGRNWKNMI